MWCLFYCWNLLVVYLYTFLLFGVLGAVIAKINESCYFLSFCPFKNNKICIYHFIVYNFKWIVFASHSTGVQNN